jgi:hypothetical protein
VGREKEEEELGLVLGMGLGLLLLVVVKKGGWKEEGQRAGSGLGRSRS